MTGGGVLDRGVPEQGLVDLSCGVVVEAHGEALAQEEHSHAPRCVAHLRRQLRQLRAECGGHSLREQLGAGGDGVEQVAPTIDLCTPKAWGLCVSPTQGGSEEEDSFYTHICKNTRTRMRLRALLPFRIQAYISLEIRIYM